MKKMQCELCGSTDIVKIGPDLFECQHCNCKYTTEQARLLIQGTVELTKGASELQRLIKNVEALTAVRQYPHALCGELTQEFPAEADAWFAWVKVMLAEIRDSGLVRCSDSHWNNQRVVATHRLDQLFSNAWNFASPAQREQYSRIWNEFWQDTVRRVEAGQYLVDLTDFGGRNLSTSDILRQCGPIAASIMQKGEQNARFLMENGLRWGLVDRCLKAGWLPYKKSERLHQSFGITFFLGRQIKWMDNIPYDDRDRGVSVLEAPLPLDPASLQSYRREAEKTARQLIKQNVCPYCGNFLQPSFLSKTCKYCRNV